ncbi:MAG: DNA-binding protein, partial [Deltaproteobacteria bacterium]
MGKKKDVDTRFSRFGTVSFTSITKVNDFIDYLEQGKVMGT